jgi:hypothetical protein
MNKNICCQEIHIYRYLTIENNRKLFDTKDIFLRSTYNPSHNTNIHQIIVYKKVHKLRIGIDLLNAVSRFKVGINTDKAFATETPTSYRSPRKHIYLHPTPVHLYP